MGRAKMSDALRMLMVQNKDILMAQRGKPPLGKCVDCKRDILSMEMYARCDKCEQSMVCVDCVDKHDHLHNLISLPSDKTREMLDRVLKSSSVGR